MIKNTEMFLRLKINKLNNVHSWKCQDILVHEKSAVEEP